jgi:poly-gamma-glutamate capsule biosynthesis protein CapA/YwtB (metallophosphatase superfamily)
MRDNRRLTTIAAAAAAACTLVILFTGTPGMAKPAAETSETVAATETPSAVATTDTSPVVAAEQTSLPVLAQEASAAVPLAKPPTLTVNAVGDMCFASAPGRLIARKGGKAPLAPMASFLARADLTLGNLECALSRRGSPVLGKAFTFRGSPKAIQGLRAAGFDAVGLGNNHARDYGRNALLDTVSYLNKGHIAHAGAGANRKAAFAPAIFRSKEATIAFLSFCQIGPENFVAGRKRAGTAYTLNLKTVRNAVKAAKRKADYVIVSFHWGLEGHYTPTSRQIAFGHGAITAGADLVLSEHPHVLQGVEFYRHKLIASSLGNFVFSPGSTRGHDSMTLRVKIGPHGIASVVARPVHITSSGAPVLAKGSTAKRILRVIAKTSRGRGSHVKVGKTSATIRP